MTPVTAAIRSSDRASSMVSLWVVPPRMPGTPTVSDLPGLIDSRLVPNWLNWSKTNRRVPSPTEVSRITEATPMAMPTMLSAERSRWPKRARAA